MLCSALLFRMRWYHMIFHNKNCQPSSLNWIGSMVARDVCNHSPILRQQKETKMPMPMPIIRLFGFGFVRFGTEQKRLLLFKEWKAEDGSNEVHWDAVFVDIYTFSTMSFQYTIIHTLKYHHEACLLVLFAHWFALENTRTANSMPLPFERPMQWYSRTNSTWTETNTEWKKGITIHKETEQFNDAQAHTYAC